MSFLINGSQVRIDDQNSLLDKVPTFISNGQHFSIGPYIIPGETTELFRFQKNEGPFTVVEIAAPTGTGGNEEATIALMREVDNVSGGPEFLDLYNNGYTGEKQYGIRIQKRGTGVYHPFIFDFFDGTTKLKSFEIATDGTFTFNQNAYAPTATAGTNNTQVATTSFVGTAISNAALAYAKLSGINYFDDKQQVTLTAPDKWSLVMSSNDLNYSGFYFHAGHDAQLIVRGADGTASRFGAGQFTINGNNIWHAGNLTPSNYAPLNSPTFTGTVSGITATMVGLGNVTNESKATMFTSPTFTGTVSGITATMVGLGNVTNESKATMFSGSTLTGSTQINSLGVGTTASGTTGEIRATNNVTAYYSDERLKDFHGTIPNALEKVLSLNGYYFTANEIAQSYGYDSKVMQVGISAQEIEKVLPEVVTDAPIGDGYKTVWYEKIIPLLIEAIKEQQSQIQELKEMISNGT